jgi:hypothetical protein
MDRNGGHYVGWHKLNTEKQILQFLSSKWNLKEIGLKVE